MFLYLHIGTFKDLECCVPDEGALLQQLSAQIERDVLAVHHACTKNTQSLLFVVVKSRTKKRRRK